MLLKVGLGYTTEDQTIFWYVARDYLHLQFPEPLFYGSPYSSHLEAFLAAPFVGIGIGPEIAIPIVSVALTALPWVLLARAAWMRTHYRVAIGILCGTFLLPVQYSAINTQAAHGSGVAVAAIGAALLLRFEPGAKTHFVFALLGSLALLTYPSSIFLTVPVALWVLWVSRPRLRVWLALGLGAAAGAAVYAPARWFYTLHPEYALHVLPPLGFEWRRLVDGVWSLDRHLGDVTPILLSSYGFLLLGMAALAGYWVRTRKWQLPIIGIIAILGIILSLGIPKVHDGSASFAFAYGRVFLAIPLLVAFLAVVAADDLPQLRAPLPRFALPLVVAGLLALGLWRQLFLDSEMERLVLVRNPVVSIVPTERVLDDCRKLREVADANGAELVIDNRSRVNAYGCGSLWYGALTILHPAYDRRTRLMLAERDGLRRVILVVARDPQFCARALARGFSCERIDNMPGVAVIRSPGISPISFAKAVGMPVRRL